MADERFTDKTVVVTGGGAGIGQGIVEAFAGAGASLAVVDRDREAAERVAAALGADRSLAVVADVTDVEATRAMATAVLERFGRIDVLINNAGVRFIAPFQEVTFESWQQTIAVNLTGTFLCSQAVVPAMLEQGRGKIVNIASTTGELALTKRAPYAASKAGVVGLTKAMAYELSSQGVWVNAVAPGPTETPLNAPYFEDDEMVRILRKEIPLGRWGQPYEVADAVLFLASDASDYICGAVLAVDGGWLTGKGY